MKWTVYITNKFIKKIKKLIFYEFIYKLIQSIPNLYWYILNMYAYNIKYSFMESLICKLVYKFFLSFFFLMNFL